jgi:predicted DNA-binding protein
MDKVISSRVSESVAHQIEVLSKRLRIPKKKVIEEAILAYARQTERDGDLDVFVQTSGAWKRRESTGKTVEKARKAFRDSMTRYSR